MSCVFLFLEFRIMIQVFFTVVFHFTWGHGALWWGPFYVLNTICFFGIDRNCLCVCVCYLLGLCFLCKCNYKQKCACSAAACAVNILIWVCSRNVWRDGPEVVVSEWWVVSQAGVHTHSTPFCWDHAFWPWWDYVHEVRDLWKYMKAASLWHINVKYSSQPKL